MQHVADTHPDASVRQTATDVRVLVATHGRVSVSSCSGEPSEHASNENSVKKVDAVESKTKPLIEVVGSSEMPVTEHCSTESTPSVFETAVKELEDVLVPVRGHAVLTLRRLIDSGDIETLNSVDKLLAVCEKTLDDPDSYVYLNSIQLLVSLASRLPRQTLPWLADKYLAEGPGCQRSEAERRMKLGEVLVKTSSALGMLLVRNCFTQNFIFISYLAFVV